MTNEQVLQLAEWLPKCDWRVLAKLTMLPAPASHNAFHVRDWLSAIESSATFAPWQSAFIVTEIAESHVVPVVHVLVGGMQDKYLSEMQEDWANEWSEIGGWRADLKCFAPGKAQRALSELYRRLDPEGRFYVELNLGFAVLESADTRFLSKEWERLCIPGVLR
jgi:hypothetical protein